MPDFSLGPRPLASAEFRTSDRPSERARSGHGRSEHSRRSDVEPPLSRPGAFGGARGCNRTDHVVGDFDNAKASVNDPAFFAVHAAFDAALDGWLAARDAPAAAARCVELKQ